MSQKHYFWHMKKMILSCRRLFLTFMVVLFSTLSVCAQYEDKREFRGAWIQCVNGQFLGMSTKQMQDTLIYQLDKLKECGVNAIIFQVRPECDALYKSNCEPWSRFLTGVQGKAPNPYWDPLSWMVEQCHKRGMELHAWINPFRAKTKTTNSLSSNHIAVKHPELVFSYDGQLILNPGNPEAREYIYKVVEDIVSRYDIDGLHIDDYFYPYPAAGQVIRDNAEFAKYNNGFKNINDWRRDNVNIFIKQLYQTIHQTKPWVKFGVSPFGIYRNKKSDPVVGSKTSGLQNYDDLYADVLMWVNNGWIDYCVPQLYWEIGHKAADYETLIRWWNKYASKRHLYIGEDVLRTVKSPDLIDKRINQMPAKRRLHGEMDNVQGTVLWYSKVVADNVGNYGSMLKNVYWKYPALTPQMKFIDGKAPKKVKKMKFLAMKDGIVLFWKAPKGKDWTSKAERYVVYKFDKGEKVDIDDPSKIVAITSDEFYKIPHNMIKPGEKHYYVVTALDRLSNESKPRKKSIRY